MQTILDTELFTPGRRFELFQLAVCRVAEISVRRTVTDGFNAKIRQGKVGFLEYSLVDYDAVSIERGPADIARDRQTDFLLAVHLDGRVHMKHLDREMPLQRGDFTIVDSTLPYRIEASSSARRVVMRVPRHEFALRGLTTDTMCGRIFSGARGTSGLASRLLQALMGETPGQIPQVGHSLTSALLDLVAESETEDGSAVPLGRSHDHLIRRIRTMALAHLADPDLSAARIAELVGISIRYLHRVFAATGTTLHKWIEDERLERARCQLLNPNQRHRSIQEVAFSCGFKDAGYFGRRFLRKYGATPSQLRLTTVRR